MGGNDSNGTNAILNQITGGALNDSASQAATQNATTALSASQSTGGLAKGHATDDPYVQTREAFESMGLADISAKAHEMNPGNIHAASDVFQSVGSLIQLAGFIPRARIIQCMDGAWTGANADKAQEAVDILSKASMQGGDIVSAVGLRLQAIAYGAEALKLAVPDPATVTSTSAALSASAVLDPSGAIASDAAQEAARQKAVTAMNAIYKPTFWPAGEGVPSYSPPPNVAPGATGPTSGLPTVNGVGGTHGGTGSGTGPSGQQPGGPQQGDPAPGQNTNAGQPGVHDGQASGAQPAAASAGDGANSTHAAGYDGAPGSGLDGLGDGGFGSGGVGGGSGGGGGFSKGFSGSGPLSSSPLTGGVVAPGRGVVPGMAPGTGAPGQGGMGMPGAGAQKKKDEKEHKIKPYLVTKENTEELLGEDQRAAPPVLGAQWDGNPKQ